MERLDSLVDTGVKSCFSFCLGPRSGTDLPTREERPEAFRGTASLGVLGAIVLCLQRKGFHMTKPAPGKTYEAFSQASLPDYKVDVILAGRRRGNSANFALLTFKPHASSRKETCSATLDEWKRLCEAINKILAEELKVVSAQVP